jgi:hypothetical protein
MCQVRRSQQSGLETAVTIDLTEAELELITTALNRLHQRTWDPPRNKAIETLWRRLRQQAVQAVQQEGDHA